MKRYIPLWIIVLLCLAIVAYAWNPFVVCPGDSSAVCDQAGNTIIVGIATTVCGSGSAGNADQMKISKFVALSNCTVDELNTFMDSNFGAGEFIRMGLYNASGTLLAEGTTSPEGSGGGEYIDNTTEAAIETGIAFDMMDTTSDYVYLGEASTFSAAKFEWATRGSYYTLKIEYYNGTSGDGWEEITTELDGLSDDTSNFESDGRISWNIPGDWATTAVNGETKYWIRISTTTTPVTVAMCYYLIPGNSVIATLALSSTELQNEDWAWCSYSGNVYVTIRNTGNVNYEGNYYLTSASSTSNKQNFFIYNHEYKADYQDTTYSSTKTQYRTTFTDVDLESGGILTVTHSLNSQYNIVAIYNNSDIVVLPDSIVATDANNTSIDLSSQGTLTGTWNLVILA